MAARFLLDPMIHSAVVALLLVVLLINTVVLNGDGMDGPRTALFTASSIAPTPVAAPASPPAAPPPAPSTKRLLIGLPTTAKMAERLKAVIETWGSVYFGGRFDFSREVDIMVFADDLMPDGQKNAEAALALVGASVGAARGRVGIVPLPGSGGYPPKKKAFRMFRWMADNMIDEYDYFAKADDDSYLVIPDLMPIVDSMASREVPFFGRTGSYKFQDANIQYCSGGAGYFIHRETLHGAAEDGGLERCLERSPVPNEDVSVGWCLTSHLDLGVSECEKTESSKFKGQRFYHTDPWTWKTVDVPKFIAEHDTVSLHKLLSNRLRDVNRAYRGKFGL